MAIAALLVGSIVGYSATVVWGRATEIEPSATPRLGPNLVRNVPPTSPPSSTPSTVRPETTAIADPTVTYLVWSTGGLPPSLSAGLEESFDSVSVVKGDVVELLAPDDGVIPLDALAIDADAHRPFDPDRDLATLDPSHVILSASSAALRRMEVGETLVFTSGSYEIGAVVPDHLVGAAEVVFSRADSSIPIATERYALVSTDLSRPDFEATVRGLYEGPAPLRIRSEGETPWFRHGDAVLPQVLIKQALGEFSYTNRVGAEFDQAPSFFAERIVTTDVPVLGEVVCHATVAEMLSGAMSELVDQGLSHLVDPAGFAGCWYPRFTRTATGSSAGVSRHAWGAAVDMNAPANPYGSEGTQDPRLVAIMESWGFTWGGDWLVPDPMHFEYGES